MTIERDIIWLGCENGRHVWLHVGGANAGCGPDCACSVDVHECANCGGCDYGENPEADEIRNGCMEKMARPAHDRAKLGMMKCWAGEDPATS